MQLPWVSRAIWGPPAGAARAVRDLPCCWARIHVCLNQFERGGPGGIRKRRGTIRRATQAWCSNWDQRTSRRRSAPTSRRPDTGGTHRICIALSGVSSPDRRHCGRQGATGLGLEVRTLESVHGLNQSSLVPSDTSMDQKDVIAAAASAVLGLIYLSAGRALFPLK